MEVKLYLLNFICFLLQGNVATQISGEKGDPNKIRYDRSKIRDGFEKLDNMMKDSSLQSGSSITTGYDLPTTLSIPTIIATTEATTTKCNIHGNEEIGKLKPSTRPRAGPSTEPGPGTGLGLGPGKGSSTWSGKEPEVVAGLGPGQRLSTEPGTGEGLGREQGPNTESGPGTGPALGPEQGSSTTPGPGSGSEQGLSTEPGPGPGIRREREPSTEPGPGIGPGQGSITGPGSEAVPGPRKRSSSEPGLGLGPGQDSGTKPGPSTEPGPGQGPRAEKRKSRGEMRREFPWGRRSFGSLERFRISSDSDEWIAYFLFEAIVVVLQTKSKKSIKECVVIEVRQEWEQQAALKTFGTLMELIPIDMVSMIRLITLCGKMHPPIWNPVPSPRHIQQSISPDLLPPPTTFSPKYNGQTTGNGFSSRIGASALIFPGTLWCGVKDKAMFYEDLGENTELDRCCRAHDYCPIKLSGFEKRYGITEFSYKTRLHCFCELEFFNCLRHARGHGQFIDFIGNLYFNMLSIKCLDDQERESSGRSPLLEDQRSATPFPYECSRRDSMNRCRLWDKDLSKEEYYQTMTLQLKF